MIISCGDLPAFYLDYLVSMLGKPLLYVCGNHDHYENSRRPVEELFAQKDFSESSYNFDHFSNFGGMNLDKKPLKFLGMLFFGFEGSYLYNHGEHQYSESQMQQKLFRRLPRLLFNRCTEGRSIDVMVTHSPPRGIHDKDDLPHRGFEAFLQFIRTNKPKYFLHGHTHLYDRRQSRMTEYMGTKIINCYDYQILDLNLGTEEKKDDGS